MILKGTTVEEQSNIAEISQAALSISQLLQFNVVGNRASSSGSYHSRDREPPLPIYMGLKVHSKTRMRGLIDTMFDLGLCISYDRILSISTNLANKVCLIYEEDDVVCPPQLQQGLFTLAAVDNIDHNPSSTTSQGRFHGTGISLFQSPSINHVDNRDILPGGNDLPDHTRITPLPESYTNVPPVVLRDKNPSVPEVNTVNLNNNTSEAVAVAIQEEYR